VDLPRLTTISRIGERSRVLELGRRAGEDVDRFAQQLLSAFDQPERSQGDADRSRRAAPALTGGGR
jgi:hypothetical protein